MPLRPEAVRSRLGYARIRIDDLLALNGGDVPGANGDERQRLAQEAFFHLIGAIEVFAQLVNERRDLGNASEDVSISKLKRLLGDPADPLCDHIDALYWNTRDDPPDADSYTGDGLMYRLWNYRHQVTHRGTNPFVIRIPGSGERRSPRRGFWTATGLLDGLRRSHPDRSGPFLLDPLRPADDPANVSVRTVHVEMDAMFELVQVRLEEAIAAI